MGTQCNNNVNITSKRRYTVVLTSQWRYFCIVCPLGSFPFSWSDINFGLDHLSRKGSRTGLKVCVVTGYTFHMIATTDVGRDDVTHIYIYISSPHVYLWYVVLSFRWVHPVESNLSKITRPVAAIKSLRFALFSFEKLSYLDKLDFVIRFHLDQLYFIT